MKRILVILFLIGLNFLNAASLSSTKSIYKVGEAIHIKVKDLESHPKNWIAIYPKGKSSAGSNVIKSKWTKKTTNGEFVFRFNLAKGEYEARVMYNNSYTPEAVVGFTVGSNNNEEPKGTAKLVASKDVYKLGETIHIKVKDLVYHPKNWIAIYPKGKSSAGSNVIRWKWTKETTNGEFRFQTVGKVITKPYLPEGEYEARVMYNNSYTPEAVVGFSVKEKLPPQHQGKVSIKSQKAQYIIPEVVKIDVKTMDSLDKRVLKVYKKNENGEWKEIPNFWHSDIGDKINKTISVNLLHIGEYEARAYYGNELLTKTAFKIKAVTDIVDTVRQYCKGKERNNDAIICPNSYDNLAHAIHYKKYLPEGGYHSEYLQYDIVSIDLDKKTVQVEEKNKKLSVHWPEESIFLTRLNQTPVYLFHKYIHAEDEMNEWIFMYQGIRLLYFLSNDRDGVLSNIHTTNKGNNLVLSYTDFGYYPSNIVVTDTYDISVPEVARLINRTVGPIR